MQFPAVSCARAVWGVATPPPRSKGFSGGAAAPPAQGIARNCNRTAPRHDVQRRAVGCLLAAVWLRRKGADPRAPPQQG
eukprot:15471419-Alexandrium_andersonii.AAC.1